MRRLALLLLTALVVVGCGSSQSQPQKFTAVAKPHVPPQGITAVGVSASQVAVSWVPVQAALSYSVFRGGVKVASTMEAHYLDAGLTGSTQYEYCVKAIVDVSESPCSPPLKAKTKATILTKNTKRGGIVGWIAQFGTPVSKALVETSRGRVSAYAESKPNGFYFMGGLSGGAEKWKVTARKEGLETQNFSVEVSPKVATPATTVMLPENCSERRATITSATAISTSEVALTWTVPSTGPWTLIRETVSYYPVREYSGEDTPQKELEKNRRDTGSPTERSYTVKSLNGETEYRFLVHLEYEASPYLCIADQFANAITPLVGTVIWTGDGSEILEKQWSEVVFWNGISCTKETSPKVSLEGTHYKLETTGALVEASEQKRAIHFQTFSGDGQCFEHTRSELANFGTRGFKPEGQSVWFAWEVSPGAGLGASPGILPQWHAKGGCGNPPVSVGTNNSAKTIEVSTRKVPSMICETGNTITKLTAKMKAGEWTKIVTRIKFAETETGEVEVFVNGKKEFLKTNERTVGEGEAKTRIGLYTDEAAEVYFAGFTAATTRSAAEANAFNDKVVADANGHPQLCHHNETILFKTPAEQLAVCENAWAHWTKPYGPQLPLFDTYGPSPECIFSKAPPCEQQETWQDNTTTEMNDPGHLADTMYYGNAPCPCQHASLVGVTTEGQYNGLIEQIEIWQNEKKPVIVQPSAATESAYTYAKVTAELVQRGSANETYVEIPKPELRRLAYTANELEGTDQGVRKRGGYWVRGGYTTAWMVLALPGAASETFTLPYKMRQLGSESVVTSLTIKGGEAAEMKCVPFGGGWNDCPNEAMGMVKPIEDIFNPYPFL